MCRQSREKIFGAEISGRATHRRNSAKQFSRKNIDHTRRHRAGFIPHAVSAADARIRVRSGRGYHGSAKDGGIGSGCGNPV